MTKPNAMAAAVLTILALGCANAAHAQELLERNIPRPDRRTLLEQPPLANFYTDVQKDGHGMPCPYSACADGGYEPPKPGIRQRIFDKKFLFATALSVGASIAATVAIHRCRRDHGIGPCTDGGYGEFKAREVLRQGLTGFLILPSYKVKRIEEEDGKQHKFWWVFPAFNAAWNGGVIIQNARKNYGPKEKD